MMDTLEYWTLKSKFEDWGSISHFEHRKPFGLGCSYHHRYQQKTSHFSRYKKIHNSIRYYGGGQAWICSPAAGSSNGHYAAQKTENLTKNALIIHHFKGSRKFRLRAAVKLFPDLMEGLGNLLNQTCFFSLSLGILSLYQL